MWCYSDMSLTKIVLSIYEGINFVILNRILYVFYKFECYLLFLLIIYSIPKFNHLKYTYIGTIKSWPKICAATGITNIIVLYKKIIKNKWKTAKIVISLRSFMKGILKYLIQLHMVTECDMVRYKILQNYLNTRNYIYDWWWQS